MDYKALYDHSPSAIFKTDRLGRCMFVNTKWKEWTGLSDAEAKGFGWSTAIHPEDRKGLILSWKAAVKKGRPWQRDFRIQSRTGTIKWAKGTTSSLLDKHGKISGYVGVLVDITQEKQTEALLRYEQELKECLLQISYVSADADTLSLTNECLGLACSFLKAQYGFLHTIDPEKERLHANAWYPEDSSGYAGQSISVSDAGCWADSIRKQKPIVIDLYSEKERGQLPFPAQDVIHRLVSIPVVDGGHVVLNLGMAYTSSTALGHDIDAFQDIANEIWESIQHQRQVDDSKRLSRIVGQSANEIYTFDAETLKFVDINLGARRNLGYSVDELRSRTPLDLKPEYSEDEFRQLIAPLRQGTLSLLEFKTIHKRKDGSTYPIEVHLQYFNEHPPIYCAIIINKEEEMRVWGELQKSQERFKTLFDLAPVCIHEIDLEGKVLSMNRSGLEMIGLEQPEDVVGMAYLKAVCDSDKPRVAHLLQLAASGKPSRFEFQGVRTPNPQFFESGLYPVYDDQGNVSKLIGVTSDDTQKYLNRLKLEDIETRFRLITENASDYIILVDSDLRMLYINKLGPGYTLEQVVGNSVLDFHDDEYKAICLKTYKRVAKTGQAGWYRTVMITPGQEAQYLEVRVSKIEKGALGAAYVSVATDITLRVKTEEQLIQAQKMESIGELAGGIAHDFNNMLGVILGHAEMGLGQIESHNPLYNSLSEIVSAANRSSNLTKQLLAFARKQTIHPSLLRLNQTVRGMLNMLGRLLPENVELAWLPGDENLSVLMDPSQLDQVLVNLVLNARDAIGQDPGSITISTDCKFVDPSLSDDAMVSGEMVCLSIKDTGSGMDELVKERLFEPFFTTKEFGTSSGLGLAVVFGIVKQNSGTILVSSAVGEGSTFKIFLPRCDSTHTHVVAMPDTPALGSASNETILVVEDESALLKMIVSMLSTQGYDVIGASCPDEAIQKMASSKSKVQLLLTDVIMPTMNGQDLAKRLWETQPDLKVVYTSGYSNQLFESGGSPVAPSSFLEKPFTLQELSRKVQEILVQGA